MKNKTIWISALAAGAALLLGGAAAWAQALPLPPGPWRATCGEARAAYQGGGKVLSARCVRNANATEYSSLRYDTCRGEIVNDRGRLACQGGGSGGGGGGGGDRDAPPGSYRSSCNGAYMTGWTLNASCRDSRGRWNRASLDVRDCRDRDIANFNGRLTCSGGGAPIPAGSYRSSCTNIYMNGSVLNAACRDARGGYNRTSLDTRDCRGRDIANVGGRLTCSRDGGGGGGGGSAALILCSQPNYGGRCVTIDRAAPSLASWDMAGRAQSARVRGRWTVCSEPAFRGRCATLERDERDLGRVGLGRRISSARPGR